MIGAVSFSPMVNQFGSDAGCTGTLMHLQYKSVSCRGSSAEDAAGLPVLLRNNIVRAYVEKHNAL